METELSAPIQLTPMLSLAVALLYMMSADGDIDEQESSQLQAVIGAHEDTLDLALEYVETVPLMTFLQEAPAELSAADKLCILCNLCDSLLSDGTCEAAELELFQQIAQAFSITDQTFSPYYKSIEFKNKKKILGTYDPDKLDAFIIPPHLAMAAAIVYMMSADGHIAEEEIGQLQWMIGEFEGLQTSAMQYVRNVKMTQFLKETTPYLSDQQKLFILANVCDSMQSDGKVEDAELRLFETVQKAFGVTDEEFKIIFDALTVKNIKPFGADVIDPKSIHTRRAKRKHQGPGGIFSLKKKSADANGPLDERYVNGALSKDQWDAPLVGSDLSNIVHRTLESNIKQVSDSFQSQEDIDLVAANANQKDRKLKIKEDGKNQNIQNLDDDAYKDNLQGVPVDQYNDQMAEIDNDSRMSNLQDEITQVHHKLDKVVPTKKWLRLDTLFARKKNKQKNPAASDQTHDNVQEVQSLHLIDTTALISPTQTELAIIKFEPQKTLEHNLAVTTSETLNASENVAENETISPIDDAPYQSTEAVPQTDAEQDMLLTEEELDGGIRLRSLALVLVICIPLVILAYGLIYPTMTCQGQAHQWKNWSPDGELRVPQLLDDQLVPERQLMQIRRGEINVNNQRFPLYKELNQSNHFAEQTEQGFKGSYSTHIVDKMQYAFEYDRHSGELNVKTKSEGVRYFDGQSGRIEVFTNFTGQCVNRWF